MDPDVQCMWRRPLPSRRPAGAVKKNECAPVVRLTLRHGARLRRHRSCTTWRSKSLSSTSGWTRRFRICEPPEACAVACLRCGVPNVMRGGVKMRAVAVQGRRRRGWRQIRCHQLAAPDTVRCPAPRAVPVASSVHTHCARPSAAIFACVWPRAVFANRKSRSDGER